MTTVANAVLFRSEKKRAAVSTPINVLKDGLLERTRARNRTI